MQKLADLIRQNKFYTVLVIFILAINLLVLAGMLSEKKEKTLQDEKILSSQEERQKQQKLFDEEEIERHQAKLILLAEDDPVLYIFLGVFNLLILFVIFLGVLFDVFFLVKWRRKEPIDMRVCKTSPPLWGLGDVVKVTLIFVSFGYLFVIGESIFAKPFPLLYNENFRMVFNTGVMNLVGISVIIYFACGKYGENIKAIGITLARWGKGVFSGVIGYIALVPVLILIMVGTLYIVKLVGYEPPVQPIVEVFMKEKDTSVLLVSTLFAAIFGPVAEEIFFRGFMYPAIKKKYGMFWSVMVTSAIFAFLHAHIVGFLPIMALGVLLAYLYERTGSLVASVTVHVMHNVGMVLLVFIMRYVGE